MEYIGRMAEILLCIICLTLVPAKNILEICGQQQENMLQVQAERLYAGMKQSGSLTREAYGYFKKSVEECGTDTTFELMIARAYVMLAEGQGGTEQREVRQGEAQYGIPMKILYREEMEEMLVEKEEIILAGTVYVNISVYNKNGLVSSCGGGIWQ